MAISREICQSSMTKINMKIIHLKWVNHHSMGCATFIVRRAGLLWSQEDFEWRRSVPLFKCLTVLEFSFILFDLCLLITFFNFIMNYVPIVTFWIFTYHKIWILSIMFCSIWSYWIIYFLACLEVSCISHVMQKMQELLDLFLYPSPNEAPGYCPLWDRWVDRQASS